MQEDIIVEHKIFGIGKILEIICGNKLPIIHVLWESGESSFCGINELEFLIQNVQLF